MKNWKQKCKRLISMMMVIFMTAQLVPPEVYAEGITDSLSIENMNEIPEDFEIAKESENLEEPLIIGELEDKREETVKHFLNEDGSFTAVKYPDPIHYKEDGEWTDIDNSLSLSSVREDGENMNVYVPSDSPVDVKFKEKLGKKGHVFLKSQGHKISWTYEKEEPLEELPVVEEEVPEKEPVEEVVTEEEPVVEESTEESITDESTEEKPAVEDSIEETLEMDETQEEAVEEPKDEIVPEEINPDDSKQEEIVPDDTIQEEVQITAEKLEKKQMKDAKKGNSKFTILDKLSDGLCYPEVYPNMDLEYILDSVYLKENLVLKNKEVSNKYILNYNIGNLTAEQVSEQEIKLVDKNGKTIFVITAPYMTDAANEVCDDVTFTILSREKGTMRVELAVSRTWLDEEDRAYPVKIDPYIFEEVKSFDKDASALYKKATYPYGTLCVGNDQGSVYGKMKSYVQFSLPILSAGDVVTGGTLNIAQYAGEQGYSHVGNSKLQINVYRVTESWDQSKIKSSTGYSGLPTISTSILDYQKVSQNAQGKWVTFDVSRAVKMWYEGTANYGLCLKANDQDAWAVAKFIASDNTLYPEARPTLQIKYRNNKGLEGYWSYHTQELGSSGTSYINDYTGNLVVIADLLQTPGERMPLNLSLVFNGYMAARANSYVTKCGSGWNLSIQQKLTPIDENGSSLHKKLYKAGYRYIYADNDGTEHYLYTNSDKKIVDEDGLGLTLTVYSEVNANSEKYELKGEDGSKITFRSSGYLRRIYDTEGNYIHIAYSTTVSNRISYVQDGAGKRVSFTYDADNRVTGVTDTAGRKITLEYLDASSSRLSKILYPDGTYTAFGYSDGRITKLRTRDVLRFKYTYEDSEDAAVKSRVSGIYEYNNTDGGAYADANLGGSIQMDYSRMNRTRFTDDKDRKETYVFDNDGRTVSVFDASGGTSMYAYQGTGTKDRKANTVKSEAQTAKFVDNLFLGHSFENDLGSWSSSDGTASAVTDQYYIGKKSARLNPEGYVHQKVTKTSGTYTVSAYIKGNSTASQAQFAAYYYDADANLIRSESSQKYSLTTGWTRVSFTFTLPSGVTYFRPRIKNVGTNDIWVDCMQLEKNSVMNPYNMLANGGFENTVSTAWGKTNCTDTDGYDASTSYGRSAKLVGDGTSYKRFVQKVYVNKPAENLHFTLSGLAYANAVPHSEDSRRFSLAINTYFEDGTNTVWHQKFNPGCAGLWQYTTGTTGYTGDNAKKTVDYVYVYCSYYNNANTAYFDHIQLNIDETGTAYTYDDKGNLISAKDNAGRKQTYSYTNANELAKETTEDNKEYEYKYDSKNSHRLVSATSKSSKIKFSFGHDEFGNVTYTHSQEVDDSGAEIGQILGNGVKYTEDGAHVAGISNDWGVWDSTTYDTDTGNVTSYTDRGKNVTSYTYDKDNDNLLSVSDGKGTTVSHTYNSKNYLTGIQAPGTKYSFTYDNFGKTKTTSAGDHTLTTNEYEEKNGNLTSSTYGNGFKVGYGYDSLDRITSKSYNGTKKFTWNYNANGQVGRHEDLENGKKYHYSYDDIGRLMRTDISDGTWFKAGYNTIDQTTSVKYRFNDYTRNVDYDYSDKDNLPVSTTFATKRKVTNSYDGLARLTKKTYVTDEEIEKVKAVYGYKDWSSKPERTTSVLATINYTTNGGLGISDRYYGYDSNCNVVSERGGLTSDSKLREGYEYDHKNQLVRHNSATKNKTYTYTYDANGNLLNKKEYPYTTADVLGEAIKSVDYTYGDSSWGDLLTAYDGKEITYDAIGNMTSFDGSEYTWQGRELRQISKGTDKYSYTYDSNGIRTSKTVNGVTTEYFLNGRQILAQRTGDDVAWFFYDSEGNRIGIIQDGWTYYYLYNGTGDVIGLVKAATGEVVATYRYDAWGQCTVTNATGYTVGTKNPFRYKGYYYDAETGFYYLNSRYYNPEIGRFISADEIISGAGGAVPGYNVFAYCVNNPINKIDSTGKMPLGADSAGCYAPRGSYYSYKANKKHESSSLRKSVKNSAEKHYSRNKKNKVNDSIEDIKKNYTKTSELMDDLHENTNGIQGDNAKYNDKYLSPNGGHYEVIICNVPNGEAYIVDESVDPLNMGTYNYASNENFFLRYYFEHFVMDMMPYFMYGNTRDDDVGVLKWLLE